MFWLSQLLSSLDITFGQVNLVPLKEALSSQLWSGHYHSSQVSVACDTFTGSETQALLEFLQVQNVKT